jgi:hypothetical protein
MEICLATREVIQHTPKGPSFFGEGRGGEGRRRGWGLRFYCCSQCVPIKFSMGSQNILLVPNVFPNMFSIVAPYFYPISFCPKFCPCNQYKQPELKGGHYNIFILGL